jgi:hypothetical protein
MNPNTPVFNLIFQGCAHAVYKERLCPVLQEPRKCTVEGGLNRNNILLYTHTWIVTWNTSGIRAIMYRRRGACFCILAQEKLGIS